MYDNSETNEWNPHSTETNRKNPFRMPVKQQLIILGVILLIIFGSATTATLRQLAKPGDADANIAAPVGSDEGSTGVSADPDTSPVTFNDISLTAEAAFVYDITTKTVLFEKNPERALPIASITKLMTALVAHELMAENDTVAISDASLRQYGNSGLMENEHFTRESLSDLVLMSSSNDGAYALAAAAGSLLSSTNGVNAFVHAMNIRAEELGLTKTTFRNTTGLDISETESGATSSARDVAMLMAHIVENAPELLAQTADARATVVSEDGFSHDAQNTNYYLDEIPSVIGSKTGYTTLAGGNLTVAFNAGLNRPVVVVALGSGRRERFIDVVNLAAAAQTAISQEAQ